MFSPLAVRLRRERGVSPKESLQKWAKCDNESNGFWTKKREGILNDLQHTKQRISTISTRYGFDSLSHFAHFCKDSFGDTPRSLRKRTANGEIVETFCICTDWIEESGDLLDWVVASQDINYLLAFNVKIPAARVRLLPEIFR